MLINKLIILLLNDIGNSSSKDEGWKIWCNNLDEVIKKFR
jgi:hypothetical protein